MRMRELSIEELKTSALESLKVLHDFCEKYNLRYYLAYGTLLGAVRHKGFIPWDDDIDVVMPREDYEFFIEKFNDTVSDNHKCVNIRNTKGYYLPAAKIIDTNTVLLEYTSKPIEIGCYIDVFPMDYLPDGMSAGTKHSQKVQNIFKLIEKLSIQYNDSWTWYKKMLYHVAHIVYFNYDRDKYLIKADNLSKKYCGQYNNKWGLVNFVAYYGIKIFDSKLWDEKILLDFEQYKFYAPKEYDKILTLIYGDYMTPPPVEKQVTHHSFKCWWKE